MSISLYVDKNGYKQMGIKINGERAKWRYSIEEQKAMIETIVKKNGSKENDYFDYDSKLKSCLPEIQNYITIDDFIEEPKAKKEDDLSDIPF